MIDKQLFISTSIRLTAIDVEKDAAVLARWTQDGRYIPLGDSKPPHPLSAGQAKKMLQDLLKEADDKRNSVWFGVRTLDESELLGITGLGWMDWANSAAVMVLNMQDLAEYGRPSSKEALALMQHYIFRELQMHQMTISTPAYNEQLAALLQEMGFVEVIRHRQAVYRFGRRWDTLRFSMLAHDWSGGNSDD